MSVQKDAADLKNDDIIIAFMGPTGSGKSNFIDNYTEQMGMRVGHELRSHTDTVRATRIPSRFSKGDIVLVDTPGFDDTDRSDLEILTMIGDWLAITYKKRIKLTGIIYLHRISDNRMAGAPHKNIRMFGELCGSSAAHCVILATTMWDRTQHNTAELRENQLRDNFWKPMMDRGSHIERFANTPQSARMILDKLIGAQSNRETLLLQEELVDLRRRLNETKAGVSLYNSLQKLLLEQKKTIRSLQAQAISQNDVRLSTALEKEYKRVEQQLEQTFTQVRALEIPIGRRIALMFSRKPVSKSVIPNE